MLPYNVAIILGLIKVNLVLSIAKLLDNWGISKSYKRKQELF